MANVFEGEFETSERPGFTYRRSRIGRQAGAERLGASVYEVPPGQATFPYHWHSANEELLIVLSGWPSLRTPDGWRELSEGDVVAFPTGELGAHQLLNRTEEHVRFLVVSEMNAPEINLYPDSGKLMAATRPPGGEGDGFQEAYRRTQATDYWEGEAPPTGE